MKFPNDCARKRGKFNNDPEGLEEFMDGVEEALVAVEAGYCWQPLYDDLEEAEHDVRLAHPQKVKAIAEAKVKTDKIDSETLAHLLRAGLLPESYVPPGTSGSSGTVSGAERSWWACVQS